MKAFMGIVITACFMGACAAVPVSPVSKDKNIQSDMAVLDKQMQAIIGDAACQRDTQCQSVGFGKKPCGGFHAYRIYSEYKTDVAAVQTYAAKYNTLSAQRNQEGGLMSNCMMLLKPALACHNKHCEIDLNAPLPMLQGEFQ